MSGAAAAKARYTDADDPKRLVEIDQAVHRAVEAVGAGRPAEAAAIYRDVIARRPDMGLAYRHLAFIEWQRGNAPAAIEQLQRALKAGDSAPSFTLPDADGRSVSSADLLAKGPLVLIFYRGVWCPYCNFDLQVLEAAVQDPATPLAELLPAVEA